MRIALVLAIWVVLLPHPAGHAQEVASDPPEISQSPLETAEQLAQTDAAQAIEIGERVLAEARASGDPGQEAAALRVIAIARYFQADFPRALDSAVEAESLYRAIDNPERQASVLSLMGAIHGSSKQHDRAIQMYRRALEVSRRSGGGSGEAIVLMNLGKAQYDLGNYDESVRRYEQSIERFETLIAAGESVRPDALQFARMGIADAFLRQGNTEQAIERAAAALAASSEQSIVYQNALAILGESHLERGELDQSEAYLNRARDEAIRTQRPAKQAESLDLLARLAAARGDLDRALTLQRTVNELNLGIYNERNSAELAKLQARYETDLRDQQIQLQGLQLQRNRWTIVAVSAVAATSILLAFIVFLLYRENQKSHRALRVLAETDSLTGLLNRRAMYEILGDIEYDRKKHERCALYLLDLDNFKEVNDRHGHPVGDKLLTEIADALSRHLREEDRIARWGGEEILIFVSGRSPSGAIDIAGRLRELVAAVVVDGDDGTRVSVTASIGVAHFTSKTELDEMVRRADAAMYAAKLAGKNQIAVYDPANDESQLAPA